ncbi:MAG: hypothetical protein OEV34_00280, partial [Gammaproteobacteria bacterium]|nr:hypothetical protein [Gammaproteobacteria bacterium]
SGCAVDGGISGKHSKNAGPVRYERLGVLTETTLPEEMACHSSQVKWCSSNTNPESCRCMTVHDAERRVRRMATGMQHHRTYNP